MVVRVVRPPLEIVPIILDIGHVLEPDPEDRRVAHDLEARLPGIEPLLHLDDLLRRRDRKEPLRPSRRHDGESPRDKNQDEDHAPGRGQGAASTSPRRLRGTQPPPRPTLRVIPSE